MEEGGRWSKPHVSTVSLHSLLELRSCLLNGLILLDFEADSLEQIAEQLSNEWLANGELTSQEADRVKDVLLVKHKHQYQKSGAKNKPYVRSMADMRDYSNNSLFHSNCK